MNSGTTPPGGTRLALGGPYGASYFGSGGGWGRVRLSPNARTGGVQDNGFMAGPEWAEPIDSTRRARVSARGGDAIGDDGRDWGEDWEWVPGASMWRRARAPKGLAARLAWLAEPEEVSGE